METPGKEVVGIFGVLRALTPPVLYFSVVDTAFFFLLVGLK